MRACISPSWFGGLQTCVRWISSSDTDFSMTPMTSRGDLAHMATSTQSTTTKTTATKRSTAGKKAAQTRSANARKRSAAAKKAAQTRVDNARTPVDYVTEYAEKAVLVPLGAGLVARDRVVDAVPELADTYSSREKAERELKARQRRLETDLRKFERRGTTARNRFEREVRKSRTRVERTLRQRRNRLEREIKAFRRDLDKQTTTTRKNVTTQAELASARVENLVQSIQTEVSKRGGGAVV